MLSGSPSLLKITVKPKPELQILSSFTALTTCCLQAQRSEWFEPDLTPLQILPNLTSLELDDGCFHNAAALQHLTLVGITFAQVKNDSYCAFSGSLSSLYLDMAYLEKLHTRGLIGCAALRELEVRNHCTIEADCWSNSWMTDNNEYFACIPSDMSSLSSLNKLQMYVHGPGFAMDIAPICYLPHL